MKSRLPVKSTCGGGGCSRRELLQGLGVAALGTWMLDGCAAQPGSSLPGAVFTTCGSSLCVDLTDAANLDLTVINGALLLEAPSDTIMLIRTSDTAVVAVSAICTHAMCSMNFDAANQRLDCPCHGSRFGEDGHVIQGPARKALRVYTASLANNVITVAV